MTLAEYLSGIAVLGVIFAVVIVAALLSGPRNTPDPEHEERSATLTENGPNRP